MRDYAELLSAYFDDNLTVAEAEALRDWLRASRANMRTFVRASVIHSRLRDVMMQHDMRSLVFEGAFGDTIDPDHIASLLDEEEATSSRRAIEAEEQAERAAMAEARRAEQLDRKSLRIEEPRFPHLQVYAAVAAVAAVLLLAFNAFAPTASSTVEPVVAEAPVAGQLPVIATVVNAFDARLRRDDSSIAVGAELSSGPLVVERGVAELRFTSGVSIVVEGPTEIEVLTPDRAKLVNGRVVVRVPHEALGFTLHSAAASFIDLGTEFGVEVLESGRASIHVLDGEVAFVAGKGAKPSRTLQRGVAAELSIKGTAEDVAFDELKFVRRVPASAYELAVLKSRPLASWRLGNVQPNETLKCEGQLALDSIVNPGIFPVDNRERGLSPPAPAVVAQFEGDHDGIDVEEDKALGGVANLTYEAWVLPQAGVGPQRIFSTFDRPRSGMALGVVNGGWYQFGDDDLRLHFTVYGKYDCVSAAHLEPGKWVHVAATVDAAGTPLLYLNGSPAELRFRPLDVVEENNSQDMDPLDFLAQQDRQAKKAATPVEWLATRETPLGLATAGRARLGRNPSSANGDISPERWQGQLASVAVYDRVLKPEELSRHFAATKDTTTDHNNGRELADANASQPAPGKSTP
ncbi:LamG-like jellyroll fold domain-containing protein [Lacipirellula parvula]|uniref:FecR protein domain-containing protein n=1 Tax=Lacipirellula parvula TaxID=2650471 RepID=A0A5K7XMN5_9BACT|nr:LamG-like jellyroll fold domain-containing protein [Lacipirellula parvula]BBO35913.1 hypothetical protein PLANPX_5525 [Lacipirellula parvula]